MLSFITVTQRNVIIILFTLLVGYIKLTRLFDVLFCNIRYVKNVYSIVFKLLIDRDKRKRVTFTRYSRTQI